MAKIEDRAPPFPNQGPGRNDVIVSIGGFSPVCFRVTSDSEMDAVRIEIRPIQSDPEPTETIYMTIPNALDLALRLVGASKRAHSAIVARDRGEFD